MCVSFKKTPLRINGGLDGAGRLKGEGQLTPPPQSTTRRRKFHSYGNHNWQLHGTQTRKLGNKNNSRLLKSLSGSREGSGIVDVWPAGHQKQPYTLTGSRGGGGRLRELCVLLPSFTQSHSSAVQTGLTLEHSTGY